MNKLKTLISRVLNVDENRITDDASPENIETWDSFSGLMLVSELENTFNVKFTLEEVTSVKCVGDIKNCLRKHRVVLDESS